MLQEKEKLLVTGNYSFSHNVFYSCISLVCQNAVLYGNGLNQWGSDQATQILQV